jgi:hypothetical protein
MLGDGVLSRACSFGRYSWIFGAIDEERFVKS